MRLAQGVYFYQRGELVYLRNVNDARDYLFNEVVYDILSYIQEAPGSNPEAVYAHLSGLYGVETTQLCEDIAPFLQQLIGCGVLQEDEAGGPTEFPVSQRVEQVCIENGQLYSATLELTYRCSERCIHCYVDDVGCEKAAELSLEDYQDILLQLRELGCIRILLTGGEVCLRKDLIDIAQYAVSLGFLVDVYTNGISMTDEQFDALCDMKVNSVSFSLYSGEAAVHDAITKVPGSFEKTLKRAMMFKCAGVDTYIKTVVIRQNLDSLESLYQLGRRIGIDVKAATFISDTHTGQSAEPFRLDTQEQRIKALRLLETYDPAPVSGIRDLDSTPCRAGVSSLSIDPYGGVHPCLAFSAAAGSVKEASIQKIWKDAPLMRQVRSLRFRDLTGECISCKYINQCSVCVGAAYDASCGSFCPNGDTCLWSKARYDAASAVL